MKRFGKHWEPRGLHCGCCDGNEAPNSGDESPRLLSEWSYSGCTGPAHWGDLDPRYAMAKTGRCQSPIDLTGPYQPGVESVFFTYQAAPLSVTNNGHSIQVDCPQGSSITVGGYRFELVQYHFHTPSEHTVDGGFYEMELHLVHQDEKGRQAVVGVFLATGEVNETLQAVWDHMPETAGQTNTDDRLVDPSGLLPSDRQCVQYDGSLTTPPCSEDVAWIMMLNPITATYDQIEQCERVIGPNNRSVQPLNGRILRCGR